MGASRGEEVCCCEPDTGGAAGEGDGFVLEGWWGGHGGMVGGLGVRELKGDDGWMVVVFGMDVGFGHGIIYVRVWSSVWIGGGR